MTEATAVGTASTDASAESVGTAAFDAEKVCEVATATSDTFCACGSIAPAEATSFSASSVVQGTPPTASGSPPLGEGGRGVVFGFGLDMKETLLEFDGFILLCTFPIVNSKMQKKEKYIIDMERLPLRSLTRWPLEIHELNLCGLHSNKKVCEVAFATSHTFFSRVFFERVPFISYFPVLPRFVMGTPCLQSGHSSGL